VRATHAEAWQIRGIYHSLADAEEAALKLWRVGDWADARVVVVVGSVIMHCSAAPSADQRKEG